MTTATTPRMTFTCNTRDCFLFMARFCDLTTKRYCKVETHQETYMITVIFQGYAPVAHKRIERTLDAAFIAFAYMERA